MILAIAGIGIMYQTIFISGNGTLEIGNSTSIHVPTQADLNARIPFLIGGAIVMFAGFGIIALGRKF